MGYYDLLNVERMWEHEFEWLIQFVHRCNSVERCDLVIPGLAGALARGEESWNVNVDDVVLECDPVKGTVTAFFELDDPGAGSTMEATSFLRILEERRTVLLSKRRPPA
jgi:hypothetical protein